MVRLIVLSLLLVSCAPYDDREVRSAVIEQREVIMGMAQTIESMLAVIKMTEPKVVPTAGRYYLCVEGSCYRVEPKGS
jgi:hypothetical protein